MRRFELKAGRLFALAIIFLGACAQQAPVTRPPVEPKLIMRPPPTPLPQPPAAVSPEIEQAEEDQMADVPGDTPLPVLSGAVEQIDCKTGVEDLHARMALEARGGQIAGFAYYSKWRPRTCSLEILRDDPETKWRLTADGATRVQTRHGSYLIHARDDAYVFEFHDVERRKYCGMSGYTNGTMTIMRRTENPQCSVAGLLDRDDVYHSALPRDHRTLP